ncbi:MAG: STAS domain-containing protein [Ignavibacteriota bacterium]
MNFKIEQLDRATIFRPNEKRLDSVIASELKAEFLILAQPDVQTLVLDLSGVEYIDSAGLSALLLAQRQQSHHQGDVRIAGARDEVRSLLALTALDRVFPMYESVEAALAAPQLSSISIPPGDPRKTTDALKSGMKLAGAAMGAAAIADLMMSGDDDATAIEDDDEYDDDDFDDEDLIDDDEDDDDEDDAGNELEIEEEEVVVSDDEIEKAIADGDLEEIEEDDLVEADDLDLDLDDEDDEDDEDIF